MDQVYQKVHRTIRALEHFTMNEWTYRSDNLLLLDRAVQQSYAIHYCRTQQSKDGLTEKTQPEEEHDHHLPAFSYYTVNGLGEKAKLALGLHQQERVETPFPMDLHEFDWNAYFTDYVLGIRKYLLKEDHSTIPEARQTLFM